MRRLVLYLLLIAAPVCRAQVSFSLAPAQAAVGTNVGLRIDDPSGCYPAPQILVERTGSLVVVTLNVTDAGPCQPVWATPRFVALGSFSAGQYPVQVFACTNAPPPLPPCRLQTTLSLTVTGSASARTPTIPILSTPFAAALALLAILIAVRRR